MKKKLFGLSIIIIIIGIIVVAVTGFNVDLEYRAHKLIDIPIGTDFNIEDIETIADEVFGNTKYTIEKAGVYSDEAVISIRSVSDEQIESLKNKINEKYGITQSIIISIGDEYEVEDIKTIAEEVFEKEDVNVEKYEEDETYVKIEAELITEDELESLNDKINEKYELSNETSSISVSNVVTVNKIPKIKLTDIAKQYALYIVISAIIVLVYFAIRFRKLGVANVLKRSIMLLIYSELLYMAIMAIVRYPINKIAIMAGVLIYIIVAVYLSKSFIKQNEEEKLKPKISK